MSMLLRNSVSLLLAGLLLLGTAALVSAGSVTYTRSTQQTLSDATVGFGQHTPATTTSTLSFNVPSNLGQVIDVDVRVQLNHTNLRQLRIVLAAPNGTTVTLLENGINAGGTLLFGTNSASGDDLNNTHFDADTFRPITDGTAPYSARFAAAMTAVEDRTPAQSSGTWELRVTDYRAGDTGALASWSITLKSADTPQTFTVTNFNDSGPGSLRDAVSQANARAGQNIITLGPGLTDGTINLTTGPIEIIHSSGAGTTLDFGDPRRISLATNNSRIFTISAGSVAIRNVSIINGHSSDAAGGGGIFNAARLTVENCTLSGNMATNSAGAPRGGAIANLGDLTVRRSTFSGNTAALGGAIFTAARGAFILTCTLTANQARNAAQGSGGAIYAARGDLFISFSTISSNDSDGVGGGVTNRPATDQHTLENSIVAGNNAPSGPDLHGEFDVRGSIIGNDSGATFPSAPLASQIGTAADPINPVLGPLANNGGPTDTMASSFESPGLDRGYCLAINGLPSTDQRGIGVVDLLSVGTSSEFSYACDCGAFELNPAVFANISTRLPVATGENVLIAGFIITTPSEGPTKKVIARGIGPSLQAAGLTGTLADPVLELYNSSGLVVTNNNWRDSQQQEILETTIPPASDLESAVVRSLEATSYTAILRGNDGSTGLGLVELYDLGISRNVVVANISTRGFVRTGQDVMIGGFILVGNDPAKVLLRAIGPSLAAAGIQQPLQNPYLELFDGQGMKIAQNDNWQETQEAVIAATGAAPGNAAESAILITLPAGSYTAIVSGVAGGTGVALVEAYNIR
jgi:subtilisin-like proprotein convertase family protein